MYFSERCSSDSSPNNFWSKLSSAFAKTACTVLRFSLYFSASGQSACIAVVDKFALIIQACLHSVIVETGLNYQMNISIAEIMEAEEVECSIQYAHFSVAEMVFGARHLK